MSLEVPPDELTRPIHYPLVQEFVELCPGFCPKNPSVEDIPVTSCHLVEREAEVNGDPG